MAADASWTGWVAHACRNATAAGRDAVRSKPIGRAASRASESWPLGPSVSTKTHSSTRSGRWRGSQREAPAEGVANKSYTLHGEVIEGESQAVDQMLKRPSLPLPLWREREEVGNDHPQTLGE